MSDPALRRIINHLTATLARDALVQQTVDKLRDFLNVDRVVLYYFYRHWEGQVTFESLSDLKYTILGSTGPDACFNGEYAVLYEAGRVRAIPNIESEAIAPCHRDFLQHLNVRANLAVPIVNEYGLWGLLIAHHCRATRQWTASDIEAMQKGAKTLALAPAIMNS